MRVDEAQFVTDLKGIMTTNKLTAEMVTIERTFETIASYDAKIAILLPDGKVTLSLVRSIVEYCNSIDNNDAMIQSTIKEMRDSTRQEIITVSAKFIL